MICASLLNNTGMQGKFYYLGETGLLTLPRQDQNMERKLIFFSCIEEYICTDKQTSQEREFPLFNVIEDT